MKLNEINFLIFSIFLIFSFSLVSAQFYNDAFYFDLSNPATLLENEWFVFGAVFLLIFALCYIALSRQFGGKAEKNKMFPWLTESGHNENKAAVTVISLVIAFFSASLFIRNGWIYNILGQAVGGWMFLVALIVMVILGVPFFKSLRMNLGMGPAIFITVLLIWVILRYFIDPYMFYYNDFFGRGYELNSIYEFASSVWFLILAGAAAIFFGIINGSRRKYYGRHY